MHWTYTVYPYNTQPRLYSSARSRPILLYHQREHAAARILNSSVPYHRDFVVALHVVRACKCVCAGVIWPRTRRNERRRSNEANKRRVRLNVCDRTARTSNSNRDVYPFYNTVIFIYMPRTHISFVVLLMPYYRILLFSSPKHWQGPIFIINIVNLTKICCTIPSQIFDRTI